MRFAGRVFRVEKSWAIEIPLLDIVTQGRTKREAYEMIADAVESLVNKKDFEVRVFGAKGAVFGDRSLRPRRPHSPVATADETKSRAEPGRGRGALGLEVPEQLCPGTSKAGPSRVLRSSRSFSRRWRPIRSS
ncbi:MAG: hypothetical protein M0C28_12335 [Candidatus Moduliflexus flocculans]|nr:hypothetical protein [Candidatus Moduliflexus flocculans]